MKFTDDNNLGGVETTSSKRQSKQPVEGEVRNPDKQSSSEACWKTVPVSKHRWQRRSRRYFLEA